MSEPTSLNRSIEEIEGTRWGDPPTDASRLITAAYALRRKPVVDLTVEDLRLLIGQQVGVGILVPRALVLLRDEPFVEGDMFEGDLLCAVLRIDGAFWAEHPDHADAMDAITDELVDPAAEVVREIERWRVARRGR
ncbi:MAG TPA: contact-dependent growth inhibition system immunity protein [Thermomicrobiales bacterium]|nr:contact-dependent growth inhibition system immunity protein [Thermomicrobiales bacterium]